MKKASDFFGSTGDLPIGETVSLLMPAVGFLKLEGQTANQADFPDLFDSIGHSLITTENTLNSNFQQFLGDDWSHDFYKNGNIVVVSASVNRQGDPSNGLVYYSQNGGLSFNNQEFEDTSGNSYSISYNVVDEMNGILAILNGGLGDKEALKSTTSDVTSWTVISTAPTSNINSLTNNGSTFVAVASDGTIWYSSNADSWTQATSPTSERLVYIYWNGTKFVAVGDNGVIILSVDQDSWSHASLSGSYAINYKWVQKDDVKCVAGGQDNNNNNVIITSLDDFGTLDNRINQRADGTKVIPTLARYFGNIWIGSFHDGSNWGLYPSTDGMNWGVLESPTVNVNDHVNYSIIEMTSISGGFAALAGRDLNYLEFDFNVDITTEFTIPRLRDSQGTQMYMRAE